MSGVGSQSTIKPINEFVGEIITGSTTGNIVVASIAAGTSVH